jgi:hypothetical protein
MIMDFNYWSASTGPESFATDPDRRHGRIKLSGDEQSGISQSAGPFDFKITFAKEHL